MSFTNNGKTFYCIHYSLKTDKLIYYNDEKIEINASWELNYDVEKETSYIQIRIYDLFDNLLWNSSEYNEIGEFNKNWSVDIKNLNLSFPNISHFLNIKLWWYHFDIVTQASINIPLKTLTIEIIKRNVSCQLIGFKNRLYYGENLYFYARFYDEYLENNSYIINQNIGFIIISNNSILFEKNFTTNLFGQIQLNISSIIHLKMGQNIFRFKIYKTEFYYNSEFEFKLNMINPEMQSGTKNIQKKKPYFLNYISFFSVLGILFLFFTVIIYNNNKRQQKELSEITFKY